MACQRLTRSRLAIWPLLSVVLVLLSACGSEKTPRIILVTATPIPRPAVLIVTAKPSPLPPVIVTAAPSPTPQAVATALVSKLGIVVLPLIWQSRASPPQ
jgi:hypothetical protein